MRSTDMAPQTEQAIGVLVSLVTAPNPARLVIPGADLAPQSLTAIPLPLLLPHLPPDAPHTPIAHPRTIAMAMGLLTTMKSTAPGRMASRPMMTGVSALCPLPRHPLRLPWWESAWAPVRLTPTSVVPSLLRRPLTMLPETAAPSDGRHPPQRHRQATAIRMSAPDSHRCPCPGVRTECPEPGTPTQTGCHPHLLRATHTKDYSQRHTCAQGEDRSKTW